MTQQQQVSLTNVVAGVFVGIGALCAAWFLVVIVIEVAESDWWQERRRDKSCVGVGRFQHLPPRVGDALVFDTCTGRYWRGSTKRWEVFIDSIPAVYQRTIWFDSLRNEVRWR